jgi:hemolysin activation/secretion protein
MPCGAHAARLLMIIAAVLAVAGAPRAGADGFALPPASASLPASAPGTPIVLHELRFVFERGAGAIEAAELQRLARPWLGRPLRALDLEDLRQAITRAYVERGYVNSGAVLDDDAQQGTTLTLRIVEGRLARVRQTGLQGLAETYLASRLVHGDEVLDVKRLQERFELQLADPLFTRIQARLLPDDAPGHALLDLEVQRARPWQLALFADNHLAPAVGAAQGGVEGSLRNLLGWGDALGAVVGASEGSVNGDASWQLPLGGTRTLLTLRLARGDTSLIEEPVAALDIDSRVHTREATLAHPLLDAPRRRWLLGLTHARRSNRTTLAGEPFSFVSGEDSGTTRVESWRLFQELTLRRDRHVLALRASLVQGRNNLAADSALPGVAPRRYRLWQLQAQAVLGQDEAGRRIVLRGQAQHAAQRLVPLEQMALGGRYTVRGYRENQFVRDNGFALGAEWHWPLWRDEARRASLTLIPFAEGARAWNRGEPRARLASIGIGLAWTLAELEGELHFARRLERRPIDTHAGLQDHGIHLSLRWRPAF